MVGRLGVVIYWFGLVSAIVLAFAAVLEIMRGFRGDESGCGCTLRNIARVHQLGNRPGCTLRPGGEISCKKGRAPPAAASGLLHSEEANVRRTRPQLPPPRRRDCSAIPLRPSNDCHWSDARVCDRGVRYGRASACKSVTAVGTKQRQAAAGGGVALPVLVMRLMLCVRRSEIHSV